MSKDLFDLFRENEDKLSQKPSPKAWSRIERRIQAPKHIAKRRNIRTIPSTMGIAATLALVIGLAVVFTWMIGKGNQQRAIALAQGPLETEELAISKDQPTLKRETIAIQNQNAKPLKPINEGRPEQKLVATVNKVTPKPTRTDARVDSIREERMGR